MAEHTFRKNHATRSILRYLNETWHRTIHFPNDPMILLVLITVNGNYTISNYRVIYFYK